MNEDEIIDKINYMISNWHRNVVEINIQWIQGLLDLYQQQKEKIEAMNKGIDELTREKQDLKTELYMNSVSKDKIAGILEKYKYTEIEDCIKIINFYTEIQKLLKEE